MADWKCFIKKINKIKRYRQAYVRQILGVATRTTAGVIGRQPCFQHRVKGLNHRLLWWAVSVLQRRKNQCD